MRAQRVLGAVLIGGHSTRMGSPKQLLEFDGVCFVERIAAVLGPCVDRVVLVGGGEVPAACASLARISDAPGLAGPLAGILAALRSEPDASWVVAACDQPRVRAEAVEWLLAQRSADVWGVLPRDAAGRVEPLLAFYDARARDVLEALAAEGRIAPREFAAHPRCATPVIPVSLAECWESVDRPADYEAWRRGVQRAGQPPRTG